MAETRNHQVTLRFARGYEFVAEFDDVPGLAPLAFDEPQPLGDGAAPSAAAVLAAAVGNCLSSSLAFCLRKSRLEVLDMTTRVVAHITRNEHGRFRITGIDVDIKPQLAAPDADRFHRCEQLFEDYCIVTESIRRGIPVTVKVENPDMVKELL